MPRVTCRCGEKLKVPPDSPERINCSRCGAHIRLRRPSPGTSDEFGDGYLRFRCPCGRHLKVAAAARPVAGKCPDCGRVVPVPAAAKLATTAKISALSDPEARTEDLDAGDLVQLEEMGCQACGQPRSGGKPRLNHRPSRGRTWHRHQRSHWIEGSGHISSVGGEIRDRLASLPSLQKARSLERRQLS